MSSPKFRNVRKQIQVRDLPPEVLLEMKEASEKEKQERYMPETCKRAVDNCMERGIGDPRFMAWWHETFGADCFVFAGDNGAFQKACVSSDKYWWVPEASLDWVEGHPVRLAPLLFEWFDRTNWLCAILRAAEASKVDFAQVKPRTDIPLGRDMTFASDDLQLNYVPLRIDFPKTLSDTKSLEKMREGVGRASWLALYQKKIATEMIHFQLDVEAPDKLPNTDEQLRALLKTGTSSYCGYRCTYFDCALSETSLLGRMRAHDWHDLSGCNDGYHDEDRNCMNKSNPHGVRPLWMSHALRVPESLYRFLYGLLVDEHGVPRDPIYDPETGFQYSWWEWKSSRS